MDVDYSTSNPPGIGSSCWSVLGSKYCIGFGSLPFPSTSTQKKSRPASLSPSPCLSCKYLHLTHHGRTFSPPLLKPPPRERALLAAILNPLYTWSRSAGRIPVSIRSQFLLPSLHERRLIALYARPRKTSLQHPTRKQLKPGQTYHQPTPETHPRYSPVTRVRANQKVLDAQYIEVNSFELPEYVTFIKSFLNSYL